MVTFGAQHLLDQYNSRLGVAEAFILGKIESFQEEFVPELVGEITLEAARIRLEAMGQLNKENIKSAYRPRKKRK